MRMFKAIARARRAAIDSGLEGALASLFGARADASSAGSAALPERLRDAAARLATFLSPRSDAPHAPRTDVVSLEQALEAKALRERGDAAAPLVPNQTDAALLAGHPHTGAGVCPFTGMRANGTLAASPTALPGQSDPTLDLSLSASEPGERSEVSVAVPESPRPRTRKPRVRAQGRESAREPSVEISASAVRAPKRREKDKEKLAGTRPVENTSGRSATRSATKQPRSRTQRSRKKA